MKVLHVITGLGTGGAEMMLLKLLGGSQSKDFQHAVISLLSGGAVRDKIEALGVPVETVGLSGSLPGPWAFQRLLGPSRNFRPDVVQGWMYHGNLAATLAAVCNGRQIPVVWGIRQGLHDIHLEKPLTAWLIRLGAALSRAPCRVLYNARASALQHESIGYNPDKTMIIPNGFDCDVFRPVPHAKGQLRADLGLAAETPLIGLIARFHPMKDHPTFLAAAARVLKAGYSAHFVLAGPGICESNLSSEIAGHPGLRERVHLLGERTDTPFLNSAFDVACTSSSNEGFPNVVGEAMACGTPCVVTDVGDSAWVVGDSGKIVPPKDPNALAEACTGILDLPPSSREQLGVRARKRIVEEFSLGSIVRQYESLYLKLCSFPKAGALT